MYTTTINSTYAVLCKQTGDVRINEGWLKSWIRHNWRRKEGPVKNTDLWQRLLPLLETHQVEFIWVKGHAENEYNNRCDELAVAERMKYK